MPTEHTPTPWHIGGRSNIVGADDTLVAPVPRPKGAGAAGRRDANVALILRAVNSHDALVEAVGELLHLVQLRDERIAELEGREGPVDVPHPWADNAIAALALATGETR